MSNICKNQNKVTLRRKPTPFRKKEGMFDQHIKHYRYKHRLRPVSIQVKLHVLQHVSYLNLVAVLQFVLHKICLSLSNTVGIYIDVCKVIVFFVIEYNILLRSLSRYFPRQI